MNDPIEEAKRLFAYLNGELNEEENRKMEEQIRQDERLQELVVQLRDKDYITRELTAMRHYDTAAAKNSFYGRRMHTELWPAGETGEKIEMFTVKDEAGKAFSFQQLAQGKKYVLIDFWASWCGPCRKEIPNVKRQYALYNDKGFQVVSISIDKNAAAWKKALTEEQLPWPNFLSTEVADQFHVKSIPAMFLVDADGTIIAETDDARGDKLAQKLAELFK